MRLPTNRVHSGHSNECSRLLALLDLDLVAEAAERGVSSVDCNLHVAVLGRRLLRNDVGVHAEDRGRAARSVLDYSHRVRREDVTTESASVRPRELWALVANQKVLGREYGAGTGVVGHVDIPT
jgi:hypothetical protein